MEERLAQHNLAQMIALVERSSRKGALSVTASASLVQQAVEIAVDALSNQCMRGKCPANPLGWGFTVGANAARRLGRAHRLRRHGEAPDLSTWSTQGDDATLPCDLRRLPDWQLSAAWQVLTPKQQHLAKLLSTPEMSLHKAAKELAMDRSNLRRMFHRILKTLQQAQETPPPPLTDEYKPTQAKHDLLGELIQQQ